MRTGDVCSFATLLVYKIPMEDIESLAKSFSELEKGELNIPAGVWGGGVRGPAEVGFINAVL